MQVTVTVKVVEQKFPGGTVGGEWRIDVSPADDPGTVAESYHGAAPSATFDLTEGDTVILRGTRLDAGGGVLGPIVTSQYTVGEDLVPIDVASSITATASPGTRGAAHQPQPSGGGGKK